MPSAPSQIPSTSGGSLYPAPFGARGGGVEGAYTSLVYGYIRDGKYTEAVRLLTVELQSFPRSRAALSLLGYCYYKMQDFRSAAQCYEELCRFFPEIDSYRVYYAQTLFKAGLYPEATKACQRVDSEQYAQRILTLQAAIAYEEKDLSRSRALLGQCAVADDPDMLINNACITFKEGKFEEAKEKFTEAAATLGYAPDLAYNVALCHYELGQYGAALRHVTDVIETGVREHPELSVGSSTGGVEVRSVGNTQTLRETALIEAFNLKAAIEFVLKPGHPEAAKEALADMPPRNEDELDPVSLHNLALMGMDSDPTGGFRKLNFLLANPPFPPETFGNLLLLYLKHGCFDLAADVMAENTHLTYLYLAPELYEFLDASIMVQTSPEEAYRKYDMLTAKHIEALRKHTKAIQDARLAHDNEGIKAALKNYDDALDRYVPVLMGMARIYWDRDNYEQVEKILRQAQEFASEHDVWKLNVAHVLFMQEGMYREAIRYYEPIVKKNADSLLDVTAIVLANLCVAYIMMQQNDEAEDIMRRIEAEEEALLERAQAEAANNTEGGGGRGGGGGGGKGGKDGKGKDANGGGSGESASSGTKQVFHLCIVNLVIGTLYCSKGNFEFGISRVIKSLEPYEKKLGTDTWFYAKRCFVGLAESLAKGIAHVKDTTLEEVLNFLSAADRHGKNIPTMIANSSAIKPVGGDDDEPMTVSQEARILKRFYLRYKGT
jgi:tetratricopeptide repeat protein 30